MRVCGVELKGSEAIICLLNYDDGVFTIPDCRQRLFTLSKSTAADSIREFSFAFEKLMQDYQVDQVVIIERHQNGKFAGSASSFKLEAAIQLTDIPVTLISTSMMKDQNKRNRLQIDFDSLGLKKFQQPAFNAAHAYHNQLFYAES